MKESKITYAICLGIFATAMIGAVINSIINYEAVVQTFNTLGYPTYLIQILGGAQILGLIILVFNKDQKYIEWVYAGYFMNFTLGFIAHLMSNSGNGASAVVCLMLLWLTYVQGKRVRMHRKQEQYQQATQTI